MSAARQPCGPRRLFTDAQVLALSDACWMCLDGAPVAVATAERVPVCERCLAALREGGIEAPEAEEQVA